jgi:hypothetical protein
MNKRIPKYIPLLASSIFLLSPKIFAQPSQEPPIPALFTIHLADKVRSKFIHELYIPRFRQDIKSCERVHLADEEENTQKVGKELPSGKVSFFCKEPTGKTYEAFVAASLEAVRGLSPLRSVRSEELDSVRLVVEMLAATCKMQYCELDHTYKRIKNADTCARC